MAADVWQYRPSLRFAAHSVELSGFAVLGRDRAVGKRDKASNDVRLNYIIVDTGDWRTGRPALVPAFMVERIDSNGRQVFVDRKKDDIRAAPEYPLKEHRKASFEDALTGYYHGLYDTGL